MEQFVIVVPNRCPNMAAMLHLSSKFAPGTNQLEFNHPLAIYHFDLYHFILRNNLLTNYLEVA